MRAKTLVGGNERKMKKVLFIVLILILIIGCQSNDEKPLSERLDKKPEIFLISNQSDTLIQGQEGTLIFIERESFTNQFGNINTDSIEIELKEIYKIEDIIAQKISMRSNGEILETGGMIHLSAFSKGHELQLKKGKELIVHFPKNQDSIQMNLFYGKKDSTQVVEWELEKASTYQLVDTIIPWLTKHELLDDEHLYLATGEVWYQVLTDIFNLSKEDKEELINKSVNLNYTIYDNGELKYKNITGSKISRRLRKKLVKVVRGFPRCKPYTRKGVPIDMKGHFQVYTKVRRPNYESKGSYLSRIEERFQDENTASLDIAELQYYIFDSKNLGWMNCDRFINPSAERINYIVKVPESESVFAKIVFTNYNTVMTGNEKRGRFIFEGLPINESVKIVVLDEKRGKPLLKIVDSKTTRAPIEVKDLTEYTLEELKEQLKEMK